MSERSLPISSFRGIMLGTPIRSVAILFNIVEQILKVLYTFSLTIRKVLCLSIQESFLYIGSFFPIQTFLKTLLYPSIMSCFSDRSTLVGVIPTSTSYQSESCVWFYFFIITIHLIWTYM
ncbi:hypothetical protein DJ75_14095 [Halorubrum sp. Eb13]|nr:hypothetical protein DJ75_14095 [Halorubrum sp. Eb13]